MSSILNTQKLTAEVQDAVAKVAIVSIMPILSMCSDTILANGGMTGGFGIGFMTGLAFHQHDEAQIDTTEFLHGLGQAYGQRMRIDGEAVNTAETALECFLAGLQKGFGQTLPARPVSGEATL